MIEITKLTKKYANVTAIDNLSLTLQQEGIYCLLGRNGAGKTTLMKLLAGYIKATQGTITIESKLVSPGNMPESVNFIESGSQQFNMKVAELVETAAALQDDFDLEFAWEMIERFELDPKKRFKQLSFGMKTMLTTIISLSNNSKVMLLDEPTLGFDAIMRDSFNNLLYRSYQAYPRLIIVSTHLIDEIAKITERFIIIDKGCLLLETSIDELDENAYTLSGASSLIHPLLEQLNCIGTTEIGSVMAAHIYDRRITPPEGVSIENMSLQDFFINLVGGKTNA
ncbi:MAG: ABC transporter ATP-binding protein [Oscillospiraceae bacterium]|nr:ABC transporter ATP-binding protein [Oscillospiraceae bacterium]